MIGKSTVVWIALASLASVILYQTSYRVQEQAEKLSSLNRQIVAEQEAIQVLRAEWAYLNDPTRLETLVAQHLLLQPTRAEQIVSLDAIPEKQPEMLATVTVPVPARKPGRAVAPARSPKPDTSRPGGSRPDAPVVLATYGAPR
ncbi:cell division protein FtsL [Rhodocista pekingensis]|uniref:Cell division protein FtsL n=1 Tax=Rhodocista pekingensis TaxID=201185 RepID=A0ABW2KXT9_9PROT